MAGVLGANLMSYLRLLTPGELDRLIQTGEKRDKTKMTDLVSADCITDFSNTKTTTESYGSHTTILPNQNFDDEEEEEEDPYKTKIRHEEEEETPEQVAKPRTRAPTATEYRFDHNLKEKQSLSAFMLDQKKQMSISQKKLKQKEVMSLYEHTGKVEVHQRSPDDDENSKEANLNFYSGLLIDKKTG